jgi:acetyl-CoA decarbonylase/synthase complex subunit epsilon
MGWGDGITRAKHPVLIIGHRAAEINIDDKKMLDYLLELAQKGNIPVIATPHTNPALLERDYTKAGIMPVVEIGHRLTDPEWKGIDGKGPYDLAIFAGLPNYMESTILSGLKHFAPQIRTMTLDNTYQPHACWSFSNISVNAWLENLKAIIEHVEG